MVDQWSYKHCFLVLHAKKRGLFEVKKLPRSINTARKSFRVVLILRGSFFDFDFWREFKIIFEILLGHESGAQGV